MRLSHDVPVRSAVFDEPNLVSQAGLVPVVRLAERANLMGLADGRVTVPGGSGRDAGALSPDPPQVFFGLTS